MDEETKEELGEGVKFERIDVEKQQREFETIRNEYPLEE